MPRKPRSLTPEQQAKVEAVEKEAAKVEADIAKGRQEIWKDRPAAWRSAIAKKDRDEDVPVVEHYALLEENLFKKVRDADKHEEAKFVVRYRRKRGLLEAEHWFSLGEVWGEERQTKKLRAMIEASAVDRDYWDALNDIAIGIHGRGIPFPDDLADWAIELHKGTLTPPPKRQSDHGRPYYAYNNRNSAFAYVFGFLEFLGLKSRMARYAAIAEVYNLSVRTVTDAIKAGMLSDGKLPRPWECWPPPPKS